MTWEQWLSIVATMLGAIALALALGARRSLPQTRTPPGAVPPPSSAEGEPELVAFVANPTKAGASELRDEARRACASRYLPEPLWFETTVDDAGIGQAQAAIKAGATTVVAVGGDGTVRAVAEALVGTGIAMGIVPLGTGNLLARNLDLPLTKTDELLRVALTGTRRPIDVGWLHVSKDPSRAKADAARHEVNRGGMSRGSDEGDSAVLGEDGPTGARSGGTRAGDPGVGGSHGDHAHSRESLGRDLRGGMGAGARRRAGDRHSDDHLFLVIAGIGFDAAMVASTDEELKSRVGWIAYFVSGAQHLHGRRLRVRLYLDDRAPVTTRVRSLLVGNCGRLPGGLTLLPDAVIDDGWLDIAAIDTRGGLVGWAQLLGEVVLQGVGLRNELPGKIGRIDHARGRTLRMVADRAEQVQVDGEVLGFAVEVTARIDPGALVVRVGDPG